MVQLFGKPVSGRHAVIAAALACLYAFVASGGARAGELYEPVGEQTSDPPIGWVKFCQTYQNECNTKPLPPREVALNANAWDDLEELNNWVNHTIRPETDMDHYGMIQWWR